MSLVITSNRDSDVNTPDGQSVYSAFSYRNEMGSTYKIPENSQVCLQSAKVNLDGRAQLGGSQTIYYDWFGSELDEAVEGSIDESTSYPIIQEFGERDRVLELTPEEVANKVQTSHLEFHPNRKDYFRCNASEDAQGDFQGYEFISKQNLSSSATVSSSLAFTRFTGGSDTRFTYNNASGIFTRTAGTHDDKPAVGISITRPLSLINGSFKVNFKNSNASGVAWGIGLSRYTPSEYNYFPEYFDQSFDLDDSNNMGLYEEPKQYFEDIGVHRNEDGELVIRQAVPLGNGDYQDFGYREIEYYNNTNSALADPGTRYDIDTNASNYESVAFVCKGEKISIYLEVGASPGAKSAKAAAPILLTEFDAAQPKDSYPKPICQTMWCLHPVLSVGYTDDGATPPTIVSDTNSLTMTEYSGLDITGYDATAAGKGGWYEYYAVRDDEGGLQKCREVDLRVINDPTDATVYTPVVLNASGAIDYKPAMIVGRNDTYVPSGKASTSDVFGFQGNTIINDGTNDLVSGLYSLKFVSASVPDLSATNKSIFVRLRNFGTQVLNARAKTQSTIIAHLPTADADIAGVGRLYYEPNRDVWLDLNNATELTVSDFNIDLIYVNEQYAKVLQGQTIVVLYFRKKPSSE